MKMRNKIAASALLLALLTGCTDSPAPPEHSQPVSSSAPVLSDVEAKEIITYYESQGFAFKTEYMEDRNHYGGQKYDPHAKVTYFCYIDADKTNKVNRIKYIVNGTDHSKADVDEYAKNYFEYSAVRTYKAADAQQAQTWAKQNVSAASKAGAVITTQIGQVVFELSGTPEVRTLLVYAP